MGHSLDSSDAVFLVVMRPGQEPTATEKKHARAKLERVFEQSDRFGDQQRIDPATADAEIDAAVDEARSRPA